MDITQVLFRLSLAALLGGIVGFEREWRGNAAGVRTNAFVCLGACLVMVVNIQIFNQYGG